MKPPSSFPHRGSRRAFLAIELLESRQLLSGFQPTSTEQLFLERLNDARANPAAYGRLIGLDLSHVAPAPPLAFHPQLIQAARQHARDMNARDFFSHVSPEGKGPGDRLRAVGLTASSWAESLIVGTSYPTPEDALRGLIIDPGVPDLGHRRHLLAIDAAFRNDNLIGIGLVQNGSGIHRHYYALDTARLADAGTYVTGVVYRDLNDNGRYDIGEGLSGVTVGVAGLTATLTYQTGGYSLPLAPGTYTIIATGGDLPRTMTYTITIGSHNVRLNYTLPSEGKNADYIRRLYQMTLGRQASPQEVTHWVKMLEETGRRDVVANAIERSPEARTRLVRAWYHHYLGREAGDGEEAYWVKALVDGATEEQIVGSILSSDEYVNRAGRLYQEGRPDGSLIQALYHQLLGRRASSLEIDAWLRHLPSLGRQGIVKILLSSGEYRGRLLYQYYVHILGRNHWPSQAEVSAWAYSAYDLTSIRVIFRASDEFYG